MAISSLSPSSSEKSVNWDEKYPSGSPKLSKLDSAKAGSTDVQTVSSSIAGLIKPTASRPINLSPKTPIDKPSSKQIPAQRPYTHNPTGKLTRNLERTFTRIFSKQTSPQDLAKRELYRPVEYFLSGSSGHVYKGRDRKGNPVAMKFSKHYFHPKPLVACTPKEKMDSKEDSSSSTNASKAKFDVSLFEKHSLGFQKGKDEFAMAKKFQSVRHVVKYIDGFESSPWEFCQVMELLRPDLMNDCLEFPAGFSLHQIGLMARSLLESLQDFEKMGFIYGDLKPENLSPTKLFQLKVFDFDSCRRFPTDFNNFGTCKYSSPEYLMGGQLTSAVDVWSLGMMLANIYCGIEFVGTKDPVDCKDKLSIHNDFLHILTAHLGMPSKEAVLSSGEEGQKLFKIRTKDEQEQVVLAYKPSNNAIILPKGYMDNVIEETANKKKESPESAKAFLQFIKRMVAYVDKRSKPADLLQDPFLALFVPQGKKTKENMTVAGNKPVLKTPEPLEGKESSKENRPLEGNKPVLKNTESLKEKNSSN